MPTITYNIFYPGIKQDDKIGAPGFIEGNNLTGILTGEGITLGPKSNKLFTTNGAMRGIYLPSQVRNANNAENFAFGDNGEIYRFDSLDNTPIYTVATGFDVLGFTKINSKFYYLHRDAISGNTLDMGQADDEDFAITNDSYDPNFIAHTEVVPIIEYGDTVMFGGSGKIVRLPVSNNPVAGKTNFSLFSGICNGIANYGNQLYLYNSKGKVDIWDGNSQGLSGSNTVNFPPRKIHQTASETFATSRDGSIYKGSVWQFGTGPLIKYKKSKRLSDNSIYQDKFNFSGTEEERGQYIASAGDSVYVGCNDGTPGIYIIDNIVGGTVKGFHKAIVTNHNGTAIDEIYAIAYDHTQDRVFYSYKAGSTYGIDYVSTIERESATLGFGTTDVFTGGTSLKKKVNAVRVSFSNIDASNTAKLYYRANNQDWILLRDINATTDGIYNRQNISNDSFGNAFNYFVDIQFKIELISGNNSDTPTIFNELMLDYTVINT